MGRGSVYAAEGRTFRDAKTGAAMRQVTDHASIHHHPFYFVPAFDDAMHHLVFASYRTGRPELFMEVRESGQLVQLTEHDGLADWSMTPSHDGRYVYFTDRNGAWRVETESCREEQLASFETDNIREEGMVAAAMGTTALSFDDQWWAVPVNLGEVSRFVVINTDSGASEVILERDKIGHPAFHPDDSNLLRYAGPYQDRMWVIERDGSNNRLVYERNVAEKEWIVHETWVPGCRELVTAKWPHGVIGIDIDSGAVRQVTRQRAWHPMIDPGGTFMVTDTTFPDEGLLRFDALDGVGEARVLCLTESSNVGAHWDTDHCPYDGGPVEVYAPQHTHPHPSFAPDGSCVVFTSDRSGHAQIYECWLNT